MFHRIQAIETNEKNYEITITFDDGVIVKKDFTPLLRGYLEVLKNREIFKQVKIGHRGRSIIWEAFDIDFCADSMR